MSEKEYWNQVYAEGRYVRGDIPRQASPFAEDIIGLVKERIQGLEASGHPRPVVWEWGCGNGRDALFFAKNGLRTVGLDLASVSIEQLNESHRHNDKLVFLCHDFTRPGLSCKDIVREHFARTESVRPDVAPTDEVFSLGVIYSRFTVHSVKEADASIAFDWAFKNLLPGGLLVLETRSVHDDLCGKGSPVPGERNAWIEDHYRRFTCLKELEMELVQIGFVIKHSQEGTGLAKFKSEDPCVIRAVAEKP